SMKVRTVVLLVAICLSGFTVFAQSDATITGVVSDPAGAAVSGAEVLAHSLAVPGSAPVRVMTDNAGRYMLSVSPGRYRLRVIAGSSFSRIEREITFAAGETLNWSPRLQLERLSATVVVTAQAEPVAAQSASASVSVVTREEIEQRQTLWLAPLLANLPGFTVSRLGRDGGIASLFLNGGNSNFTKVLVDGTPVNEPGGAMDFSNFALDNVEKIEVVRGAESALFGSDAMTGVVQVFSHRGITRRPALTLLAEGGKFSTGHGAAQLSGAFDRFDYSAAASAFYTSGQERNDSFRNTSLAGNFGWRFSEANRLRLSLRNVTSDAGVPGQTLFTPTNLDQHNGLKSFSTNLSWDFETSPRWRHHLAGTETYIRQLFDNPRSDFCDPNPPFICDFPFTVRNQFNRAGFAAQTSYLAPRGGVTFGYNVEVENGFLNTFHARRNNQAGYVELRAQPWHRLSVNFGARAEANASFGTRVVPRGGFSLLLRNGGDFWGATRLRLSAGLGIKEPTLVQSFAKDPCFPGNADLRPERSRSVIVGLDQALAGDRVRASIEYFDNRFRDIVSFTFCFPGGPCPVAPPPGCPFGFGTFFNTDLARARGGNFSAEAHPVRWLRIAGNYSFTPTRVLRAPNAFDPTLQPGNRLFKRPVHSGSVVLNADFLRMNWNLVGTFVGRRTDSDFLFLGFTSNPGYGKVDLAASYNFGRGVSAFGRVENLFDKKYQESLGYAAYRRAYRLGMRFRLSGE
ncbi:MAG TPA: TonB-dependent receptor, partial [Candidatus Acidoferrales bacterium]|nr:TonB-dependent receptor [Candidatus Acidoferrales bacterium]